MQHSVDELRLGTVEASREDIETRNTDGLTFVFVR